MDGRVVLNCIVKKWFGRVWSEISGSGEMPGSCEYGYEHSVSVKLLGISLVVVSI
jgi:hypothetical protein